MPEPAFHLLALDPATQCGWALGDAENRIASGAWDLSVRRDESGGMRLIRFRSKLNTIHEAYRISIVVFEAARHAMPKMQGALVVQAELQGVLKLWCESFGIAYRGYSPAEIKKHATGKGSGKKVAVMEAARLRWPEVKLADDNEADSLWLLSLAQKELAGSTAGGDNTGDRLDGIKSDCDRGLPGGITPDSDG